MNPRSALVELHGITKSFSGVRVLNKVSISLHAGEVHALLGENGAGKSTLMKVLAGMHAPDEGEIRRQGRPRRFRNAHEALQAGIAMIYQELLPFLDLTVAENILMGREPRTLGWIDRRALHHQSEQLLSRLGASFSPARKMRELSVAEMQVVEIAKALAHKAEVIIMDEPTSALSDRERDALFRIIGDLRRQGAAVVYISHKLEEVFQLADRITVLRDGCWIATHPAGELSSNRLIELMVGRDLRPAHPETRSEKGDIALSVRRLSRSGRFQDISFDVRRGEVLGLAGLMGAGRTEVINAIFGLPPAESGEIRVDGRSVGITCPRDAIRAGLGWVSEDRKLFGLVPALGVKPNLTLASLRRWCRAGFINQSHENRMAAEQVRALSIKIADLDQPVDHLSGGNQQKTVLGRTLLTEPRILLLDEPTRGIDIAAKAEIHALIHRLVREGLAVVLVSSELPELLALSDRILVMGQGAVTAELEARRTTSEEILKYAMP